MKRVIATTLRKKAPAMIPTSGERALQNDCYAPFLIDEAGEARLSIREIDSNEVRGKWSLDGRNFTEDRSVPLAELPSYTLYVQHYYRGWTFYSVGIPKFLRYRWSRWPWIRVKFDRFLQSRFNKKELPRQDRMKVLSYIMAETIKDRTFTTHPTSLLTHFYSVRWVHRPDMEELMTYYTFLLDSLKVSEDLAQAEHNGYRLNPKALNTIAGFEQEERRHGDNFKIQNGIFWLTMVLMGVGLVQAGAAAYEQWWKPPETFTGTIGSIPITLEQK
ncbi:hypothetical protein V6R85_24235 [Agrobacterium sp. CCNWLW32]|uniref:hypothetical protein n=1 Tax=Agrobacterium sp. CCNWLW32 TaxID=3122072 RepID=UPI00301009AF